MGFCRHGGGGYQISERIITSRITADMGKRYIYVKKRYVILVSIIDFVGSMIFAVINYLKGARRKFKIEKIAVIELAHIGDVLAITPAIHLLRKRFPDASITAIVSPWSKDVLSGNTDVNDIITYRAAWFDRIDRKSFSLSETMSFVRSMRGRGYDMGVDMRGDFRAILLIWLCGIKKRVGYGCAGGKFFLTDIVPFEPEKRQDAHQVDHNLNLIRAIDGGMVYEEADRRLRIFYSDRDIEYIDGFLRDRGISSGDFLIAVHPGSGLPAKRWPLKNYTLLIDKIIERYGAGIVLVGGHEEECLTVELGPSILPKVINAAGKTSINQLAALLKKCGLFVGGDSAVMHIASAMATPIVAIWGGHNKPSHWMPLGRTDIVIHKDVYCAPCGLRQCGDLKCLKLITIDDVMGGIEVQMKRLGVT